MTNARISAILSTLLLMALTANYISLAGVDILVMVLIVFINISWSIIIKYW